MRLNPGVGGWSEIWKSSARARKPLTQEHSVRTHWDPCCAIAKKKFWRIKNAKYQGKQTPKSIKYWAAQCQKIPKPTNCWGVQCHERGAKFNSKTEEMLFAHKSHSRGFPQSKHRLLWKWGSQFFNYVMPMCVYLLGIRLVPLLPQSPPYILRILQG